MSQKESGSTKLIDGIGPGTEQRCYNKTEREISNWFGDHNYEDVHSELDIAITTLVSQFNQLNKSVQDVD